MAYRDRLPSDDARELRVRAFRAAISRVAAHLREDAKKGAPR
jgi:hypothetical protein